MLSYFIFISHNVFDLTRQSQRNKLVVVGVVVVVVEWCSGVKTFISPVTGNMLYIKTSMID